MLKGLPSPFGRVFSQPARIPIFAFTFFEPMVELFLIILLPVVLLPQFAAGILAKQNGRSFWFWFWISFIIPMISLIVLMFLEDKNKTTDKELVEL